LQKAVLEEGVDIGHAGRDEDLKSLHKDPRWDKMLVFMIAANAYFETSGITSTPLILPKGYNKSTPITVVAWLHGLGSRPDDFVNQDCQSFADELNIAFVGISGTAPRGPRSFVWTEDPAQDAKRVNEALGAIADRVTIKKGHIIAMGFSQGAQMGLEIAVRDPVQFAGAIVMSAGAKSSLSDAKQLPALAKRGFIVTCGAKELPGNVKLTADAADWLRNAKAKVQHLPYAGMSAHAFPPDFDDRFPEWVKFIESARN
jgi:predicted esterase